MKRLILPLIVGLLTVISFTASATKPAVTELKAGQEVPQPTDNKAVVIDFNASWCMPCRMFKPTFDRVAAEYASEAEFISVNTDQCQRVARAFGVSSIPYIVVLRKDREPVVKLGASSYDEFKAFIEEALK